MGEVDGLGREMQGMSYVCAELGMAGICWYDGELEYVFTLCSMSSSVCLCLADNQMKRQLHPESMMVVDAGQFSASQSAAKKGME